MTLVQRSKTTRLEETKAEFVSQLVVVLLLFDLICILLRVSVRSF